MVSNIVFGLQKCHICHIWRRKKEEKEKSESPYGIPSDDGTPQL